MNVWRRPVSYALRRAYSTPSYVPPSQLQDVVPESRSESRRAPSLVPPSSPSFYTTRPVYFDQVNLLEQATAQAQGVLKHLHLLPLPAFARASLPPLQTVWKAKDQMAVEFETKMTTTRYRKITTLLNQLNEFRHIAHTAGCIDISDRIQHIIALFENPRKDAVLARGKRKAVILDEFGRSYTVGKRKTSSARVWVIPVQPSVPELAGLPPSAHPVTTTTILINNLPLNEFFTHPADRERITHPLRVAGVLGAYNIFSIVRGGGTTGQSGALAHGIAKGIVAHEPELETLFRRAKLTWRDPRMVERKKTGLPKARKRYAWVKR